MKKRKQKTPNKVHRAVKIINPFLCFISSPTALFKNNGRIKPISTTPIQNTQDQKPPPIAVIIETVFCPPPKYKPTKKANSKKISNKTTGCSNLCKKQK